MKDVKRNHAEYELRRRMYDGNEEPRWVAPSSFLAGMVFVLILEMIIRNLGGV
jgi:ABC-type Fe3+-siderophore transport system permease subunit